MRVTSRGFGLGIAGPVLVALGFAFGYVELAVLGCACVAAIAGAWLFVAWRPHLDVARAVAPDRVMRGESSTARIEISNASRFFGATLIARDQTRPGSPVAIALVRVRPGRVTAASYEVPTRRRGIVEIGPLEVTRRDPLGLVGVVRHYG